MNDGLRLQTESAVGRAATRVALLGASFVTWGGGIDFLRYCANALALKAEGRSLKLYLLIPEDNPAITDLSRGGTRTSCLVDWVTWLNEGKGF